MSFPTFIALRYLTARKTHRFVTFLSLVSLTGIFISVAAFLIIHSVMNGFSSYLKEALIGFDAHIVVNLSGDNQKDAKLSHWLSRQKEVSSVLPIVEFDGLLETVAGMAGGSRIRGVELGGLRPDQRIKYHFFEDEDVSSLRGRDDLLPGLLVGEDLYTRLKFPLGSDETVTLINPFGEVGPSGELEPVQRQFRIVGFLSTGFYNFDTRYVIIDSAEAQWLTKGGRAGLHFLVRLHHEKKAAQFKEIFQKNFPGVGASTWQENNSRLFTALKLERAGMFLLLALVTLIASFNILGLVTLLAVGKSRDVALFYALGTNTRQLSAIFYRLGGVLGICGTMLGLAVAFIFLYWLKTHPLPLPPAYYLDTLPVKIDPKMVVILVLMAPCFSVLASLWPALKASKVEPMELLRVT